MQKLGQFLTAKKNQQEMDLYGATDKPSQQALYDNINRHMAAIPLLDQLKALKGDEDFHGLGYDGTNTGPLTIDAAIDPDNESDEKGAGFLDSLLTSGISLFAPDEVKKRQQIEAVPQQLKKLGFLEGGKSVTGTEVGLTQGDLPSTDMDDNIFRNQTDIARQGALDALKQLRHQLIQSGVPIDQAIRRTTPMMKGNAETPMQGLFNK